MSLKPGTFHWFKDILSDHASQDMCPENIGDSFSGMSKQKGQQITPGIENFKHGKIKSVSCI